MDDKPRFVQLDSDNIQLAVDDFNGWIYLNKKKVYIKNKLTSFFYTRQNALVCS